MIKEDLKAFSNSYVTVYAFKEQSDEEVYAEPAEVRKRTKRL
jgi:hypothetical protein